MQRASIENLTRTVAQLSTMINQIQATLVMMETELIYLVIDHHEINYRCDGQEIDTTSYFFNSQIQEQATENDFNKRISRLLEKYQLKNTGIKTDVLEFQGKSELESKVDQVEMKV
eukprot:TRINITY_DN38650_c0_g1_i1.p1 TRINITY_DN38650_c0_g1~~TRINITY_DN38650_c0_g1_i1.p1  ORF type:complete len:116 (-),score=18.58 TRINITY_DN38650_c0_g1_i1:516-863(-)